MTQQQAAPKAAISHRWAVLAILCTVQFMLTMDDNVVNVALPSIRRELGGTAADLAWVVNAYILAYGGLLIVGGRLGDRFGMARSFAVGTGLFAFASLACGLAVQPWQLILARFVQGTGAALVAPTVLGFIMLTFTDAPERARALSVWGTTAIFGSLSGVIISGLLTGFSSWRWVFFINLPVAAAAMVLLPRLTRGSQPPGRDVAVPVGGAALLVTGLGVLVFGLLSVHADGGGPRLAVLAMVAAALLAAFATYQHRTADPLVPRGLFAHRSRVAALVAGILISAATFPAFFTLTLYLQNGRGYSPLEAGLAYVPVGVASIAGIRLGSRVMARLGGGPVLVVTGSICAAGGALLVAATHRGAGYVGLLPGMLMFFAALGAAIPAAAEAAIRGVDPQASGIASAMVNSTHQLGGVVGLAGSAALLGAAGTRYATGLGVVAVLSLLAVLAALLIERTGSTTPGAASAS